MSGWEKRVSKSRPGVSYYYNTKTGESRWQLKIRASHILVKHKDSRRPADRNGKEITRTKESAIEILQGYQKLIDDAPDKGEVFRELAGKYSDCSSAARAGDLGEFGLDTMQKPFENAAFALAENEISGVVETDSGVHLIMRTDCQRA